jgi:ankyrin repeat protein
MSSDDLRQQASLGNSGNIAALLKGGANPCSVDDNRLTALHLATFNGHFENVRYLVANDIGSDDHGVKKSSLNMQSNSMYSALHLTCLESSVPNSDEIRKHLVNHGCNPNLKNLDGKTALALAIENDLPLEAIEFLEQPPPSRELILETRQKERAQYGVQKQSTQDFAAVLAATGVELSFFDALRNPRIDKIPVPKELGMPEHYIKPYAEKNFKGDHVNGAQKIRNLVKCVSESAKNAERREVLAHSLEHEMMLGIESETRSKKISPP